MGNHTTAKTFKIHHNKAIGTVIFVVEGASDEFQLVYHIFHKILHYRILMAKRNSTGVKEYVKHASTKNRSSRVIIMNTSNSNIKTLRDSDEYRDEVYRTLLTRYQIDPKNSPIYYIWDRDRESNNATLMRSLVGKMGSAYDNEYCENGLLLLNYPALESYHITCLKHQNNKILADVKSYKKSFLYKMQPIDEGKVLLAATTMHSSLLKIGTIKTASYQTAQFGLTNRKIFAREEAIFRRQHGYHVLSLLTIALIDLGILEIIQN